MCLIKTLLRKTHWDKNSVKEKEYTIIISVASLKTLPGKPSGTKPWLREKSATWYYLPLKRTTLTFSHNNISFTPPSNNIPFVSIEYINFSIIFLPMLFEQIFMSHCIIIKYPVKIYSSNISSWYILHPHIYSKSLSIFEPATTEFFYKIVICNSNKINKYLWVHYLWPKWL